MRYRLRTLMIVLAIAAAVLGAFVAIYRINEPNLGGNIAALGCAHSYAIAASVFADQSPEKEFQIATATPKQLEWMLTVLRNRWVSDADFLVSTKPVRFKSDDPKQIVVVCNRPFTNVPQHFFRNAPPSHAAAFTDGSTTLLTASEFAALDVSSFVPLNEIVNQRK